MTTEHAHGPITIPLNFPPKYSYFTLNLFHLHIYIAQILKYITVKKNQSDKNT